MTKHKNIPLPRDGNDGDPEDISLFERASSAFGLGDFRAAPIPDEMTDRPMKRARPIVRDDGSAQELVAHDGSRRSYSTPVRVSTVPAPSVKEAVPGAAAFDGSKHRIDRAHLRHQGLIDPDGAVSELMEEFRIVKRQLLSAARERGTAKSRRILVSSPHAGEGKTFCAVNLAIAMAAERDMEVLLVDADIAKPSVARTLGLPRCAGLMDALRGDEASVTDLVLGTDIPNLWVLPAGTPASKDAEAIASSASAEIFDRLTLGVPNRVLIFDTPPALAASPAAELAKHVGQLVLVARADRTGRNALEDACQLLSACEDIKLLLNAASFSPSGRRFGGYYE